MTPKWKRLWGIRHVRSAWHCYHFNKFLDQWAAMGGVPCPQQSDLDHLDAILRGEA